MDQNQMDHVLFIPTLKNFEAAGVLMTVFIPPLSAYGPNTWLGSQRTICGKIKINDNPISWISINCIMPK